MATEDKSLYIGLMSGTSADGIDAVLASFGKSVQLIEKAYRPYPKALRDQLLALNKNNMMPTSRMCQLDKQLGEELAQTVNVLIESTDVNPADISAIGSHGHTALHAPNMTPPFTLQIGCGATIADQTGIATVCDFRSSDVAAGGQGAPVVPAFHRHWLRRKNRNTAILNIGGIANLTLFSSYGDSILGFDTGPGNALMDEWCFRHTGQRYDYSGQWARTGTPNVQLLGQLMSHRYFEQPPPKSTGRDLFSMAFIDQAHHHITENISNEDIQATLCELTAMSISAALTSANHRTEEIYVCGGGAHNAYLMERLGTLINGATVSTTEKLGIDPDWVEAIAFAWFAKNRILEIPLDMTTITGAKTPAILGCVYLPSAAI